LLEGIRRKIATRAFAHLHAGQDSVLVVATPPGTGKSTAVAALGDPQGAYRLNLAWIAERHDMADEVPALAQYNHIKKCMPENCPEGYAQHQQYLDRGLATWQFHQQHHCAYAQQFSSDRSAFYQLAHVHTQHTTKHADGIVIDELDLTKWLESYDVTQQRLLEAEWYTQEGSRARQLLTATVQVLLDARLQRTVLGGLSLYRALDAQLSGQLVAVLEDLRADPEATRLYPNARPSVPLTDVPVRVLAHLWHGLDEELWRFQRGDAAWNSHLQVKPGDSRTGHWYLAITAARAFRVDETGERGERGERGKRGERDAVDDCGDDAGGTATRPTLPPRIVLDGTADLHILQRLMPEAHLESYTVTVPDDLPPPSHMRHIAVRKRTLFGGVQRYSKTTLRDSRDGLAHAIKDVSCVLNRLDRDGALRAAGTVGLITFEEVEAEMRAALGIAEGNSGHFWAVRGSNQLAHCGLLLVVGRPALAEDDIFRLGSFLYANDPQALTPGMQQAKDKTWHYRDSRLEQLATSITRAELTQCAHRNRPLIYDGRTVVTFCDEAIGFLPVTTVVEELPRHPGQLSNDEKLEQAAALLVARGREQRVRALQEALRELYGKGLHAQVVTHWHRAHPQHSPQSPQAA
jgi:hypothetical protein